MLIDCMQLHGIRVTFIAAIIWLLVNVAVCATMPDGCKSRNLSVTVDDILIRLFIDGREITGLKNADNWQYLDTVDLPCTTRIIAVEANDTGGSGGILGSTDDGYIKTNSSWKCTDTTIEGWQEVDFNDSTWKEAVLVSYHDRFPETTPSIIRKDASWIWTQGYVGQDLNVFCRRKLDVDECHFGQPINECDPSMGRCISLPTRGYNCSCYPGYQNDGQHQCKDVDECLLGPPENKCNSCSGNCTNTPGSYKCRCYQGFTNAGDQRCEGSSNISTLPLILGVSLGVSFLIIVALIIALSILCSRTSTSKGQVLRVVNTGANRSDIVPSVGNIASNKPSSPEGSYAHLTLNALRNNESDNYEQIIE